MKLGEIIDSETRKALRLSLDENNAAVGQIIEEIISERERRGISALPDNEGKIYFEPDEFVKVRPYMKAGLLNDFLKCVNQINPAAYRNIMKNPDKAELDIERITKKNDERAELYITLEMLTQM
jgi:hypothetical protein